MIVHNSSTLAPIIGEALNNGTFDLRFVFGLSNVIEAVQKQKPSLLLFDISSSQKPMEKLFLELMELKSARSSRKIILSDSAGPDDMVTALDSGADDFMLKPVSPRETLDQSWTCLQQRGATRKCLDSLGDRRSPNRGCLHPASSREDRGRSLSATEAVHAQR
jgi:DNA-binding response OmpR family regulator